MERDGEDRHRKNAAGTGKLPFNSGVTYANMVRRLPLSNQAQDRNGDLQRQQQQPQCLEFNSCRATLEWLEGSFIRFLKVPCPFVTLRVGMQKEGFSDCEVHSIGRKTVLLTATKYAKMDQNVTEKGMVNVDKEPIKVVDWMGGVELSLRGKANIASSPSISISIVPDSFGQDITDDHIPSSISPPQVAIHNSKCKLDRQVMIADTENEDRDNDESGSVHVGNAYLPQEVMGLIASSGKLKRQNGGRGHRV
ncbi:hypothetical protein Ancab_008122 [Ancistrocladus abbreviatus]